MKTKVFMGEMIEETLANPLIPQISADFRERFKGQIDIMQMSRLKSFLNR